MSFSFIKNRKYEKPDDLKEVRTDGRGNKIYWCCSENGGKCGGVWQNHKPSECHGGARRKRNDADTTNQEETKGKNKPEGNKRARIARALAKNIEIHSTSEDEDEMECDST